METRKLLPVALAGCLPVLAFGESCIVSGSVVREPASVQAADPLQTFEARCLTSFEAAPLPTFESRILTALVDVLQEFRSDVPTPFVLLIR